MNENAKDSATRQVASDQTVDKVFALMAEIFPEAKPTHGYIAVTREDDPEIHCFSRLGDNLRVDIINSLFEDLREENQARLLFDLLTGWEFKNDSKPNDRLLFAYSTISNLEERLQFHVERATALYEYNKSVATTPLTPHNPKEEPNHGNQIDKDHHQTSLPL